jgi:succinoglycan biosynthesis transport protein ExoP
MNNISFPSAELPTSSAPSDGQAEKVPLITQYLSVIFRWKWLIIGCVVSALLVGLLLTLLSTPQYTATTRLEINRESAQIVNVREVEPETSAIDMEFYQTQYGLLESRALAERVARELKLVDNVNFFEMFGEADLLEEGQRGSQLAASRRERERVAVKILLDNIEVTPIRLSRLVDVHWTSPDAQFSAQVANAWADAFIESNLERRFEATAYARRFLEQRLEQLRQRLEESERQLVGYASNQAIINIPAGENSQGVTQERSLTADSLASMNQALAQATADRIEAESRANNAQGGATPEALTNSAITNMRQRRADAAAEYARLLTQFEPNYPPALALAAQIRELDASIAREEGRVRNSLRDAYRDSVKREQTLAQRVDTLKENFLDLRTRSIQYNIFQREVDTNRELYDGLLQRYKEIGIAGGVGSNNVSVVDPAQPPQDPSSPQPLVNMMLALLLGLVAGIGLAMVRDQLDETISDPGDLEKRLGIPLLGAVPVTNGEDPREELADPKSGLTEAYLSIQGSLAFASEHGIPRTLAVTSTRASEGKSTSCYALAYAIARSGKKTILVDADMRSPSVHESVGISNSTGLSNYLTGNDDVMSLLQHVTGNPVAFMAAGPMPTNAAELLRGPRFDRLIKELQTRFDHVLVDSPPVLGLADAPSIGSRMEGVIFVLQAGAVKARIARRALERLEQSRVHVIGAVLTRFDARRALFGYGYDYGYGYGQSSTYGGDQSGRPTV